MFNVEKLLGKILQEVVGGKKGKKNRKGAGSFVDNLSSGAGLMTAIGLGVGAFEIYQQKNRQKAAPTPPPPPAMPPPTPPSSQAPPVHVAPPPLPPSSPKSQAIPSDELAVRMIQAMIAAAHADGILDEQEEKNILERLSNTGLSQDEKMFLLEELHNPKTIAQLTSGITEPSVARTMYSLAATSIEIDTETERQWLDELAAGLKLSRAVQQFIEEEM